jgi:hypothetical protein
MALNRSEQIPEITYKLVGYQMIPEAVYPSRSLDPLLIRLFFGSRARPPVVLIKGNFRRAFYLCFAWVGIASIKAHSVLLMNENL